MTITESKTQRIIYDEDLAKMILEAETELNNAYIKREDVMRIVKNMYPQKPELIIYSKITNKSYHKITLIDKMKKIDIAFEEKVRIERFTAIMEIVKKKPVELCGKDL